ncbi:MAG: M48 family metallopeptidase [Firmicutes bacterium]|nr:M48 family metallopeptidase [Bacillota bacterium]
MKLEITHENRKIEFNIIRSNRKTMEIRITPPSTIIVRAPGNITEKAIIQSVEEKKQWILNKLDELKDIDYSKYKKSFVEGEKFLYLGDEYTLQFVVDPSEKKIRVTFENNKLYIISRSNNLIKEKIKLAIEKWYREETLKQILNIVEAHQLSFNSRPRSIRVKEQKKRWGSCNSKKDLMFNWRLGMAPVHIIEYVVVHEMCHMVHLNHSKDFWNLVEKINPDYKERKVWFKKNGHKLTL